MQTERKCSRVSSSPLCIAAYPGSQEAHVGASPCPCGKTTWTEMLREMLELRRLGGVILLKLNCLGCHYFRKFELCLFRLQVLFFLYTIYLTTDAEALECPHTECHVLSWFVSFNQWYWTLTLSPHNRNHTNLMSLIIVLPDMDNLILTAVHGSMSIMCTPWARSNYQDFVISPWKQTVTWSWQHWRDLWSIS